MVRVIFSLDTEDYITPQHDDAVEFWAKLFAERKIRGCFNVVAEYARALKARKRGDIINLVSGNEADYHSNVHSVHPTFPEYLDTMDWDDGINEVIRKEAEGIKDVEDIFGQHPSSYMQPGGSFAPPGPLRDVPDGDPGYDLDFPFFSVKTEAALVLLHA